MEFFESLIELLCGLLVEYRQLYWLRDIRPIKRLLDELAPAAAPGKNSRGAVHGAFFQVEEDIGPIGDHGPVPYPLPMASAAGMSSVRAGPARSADDAMAASKPFPAKISARFDSYFADRPMKLKVSIGSMSVSLFECKAAVTQTLLKTAPFFQLVFPAWSASLQKEGERTTGEVFGIAIMSAKPAAFVEVFFRVSVEGELNG